MTSTDEAAKAVMRDYADSLEPPPVADVIARAEDLRAAPQPRGAAGRRSRGLVVLAGASVAAVIAVVAIAADWLPDRGTVAAPPPTASTGPVSAPGCPPGLPLLEGPLTIEGMLRKPITAKAGQQLTLPARIHPEGSDRPLLSFQIYLLPHGVDMNARESAVAQSPLLRLTPDQRHVAPVVQIPAGLVAGTYDVVGYATWPSPSLCGVPNKAGTTQAGTSWGVLGWVAID